MLHVLISVHKTVSGKIRVPKKTCQVNYIKPLFMSLYIDEISTVHFFTIRDAKFVALFGQIQLPHKVIKRWV
jgi:hypothetical protein